jgi:hypothetical protein
MKTLIYLLSAIVVLGLVIVPSRADTGTSTDLTKQLAAVCFDIHKIKPGTTRAELDKIFRADTGGVAWPESKPLPFQQQQSFVYRGCQIIKVDVEFAPSDSKEVQPTDIITKISKPYLDESPRA